MKQYTFEHHHQQQWNTLEHCLDKIEQREAVAQEITQISSTLSTSLPTFSFGARASLYASPDCAVKSSRITWTSMLLSNPNSVSQSDY